MGGRDGNGIYPGFARHQAAVFLRPSDGAAAIVATVDACPIGAGVHAVRVDGIKRNGDDHVGNARAQVLPGVPPVVGAPDAAVCVLPIPKASVIVPKGGNRRRAVGKDDSAPAANTKGQLLPEGAPVGTAPQAMPVVDGGVEGLGIVGTDGHATHGRPIQVPGLAFDGRRPPEVRLLNSPAGGAWRLEVAVAVPPGADLGHRRARLGAPGHRNILHILDILRRGTRRRVGRDRRQYQQREPNGNNPRNLALAHLVLLSIAQPY